MTSGFSERVAAAPAEPAPVPNFELEVRQADSTGTAVAHLHGELDMVTAPAFEARLTELCDHGARRLTLDLAQLAFIDSSGLSALVASLKRFQGAGGDLVLRAPSRATAKVLEICGLSQVFTIEDAPDAADPDPLN